MQFRYFAAQYHYAILLAKRANLIKIGNIMKHGWINTCQKRKCLERMVLTPPWLQTSLLRTWEANCLESCTFTISHLPLVWPAFRSSSKVPTNMISNGGLKSSPRLFNFPLWPAFGATMGNVKYYSTQTLGKLRIHSTANQWSGLWVCSYSWPPTTSRRAWHTLATLVSSLSSVGIAHRPPRSLYCQNSCTRTETQSKYRKSRYACVNKRRDVARQR
jgi:hypothetical protein